MKRESTKVCLPRCLVEKIRTIGLKKRRTSDALKLCEIFIRNSKRDADVNGYVPLAAKYLQRIFGCSYNSILFPLKEHNIIQAKCSDLSGKETYKPGKLCKHYRINPELLETEIDIYDTRVKSKSTDVLLNIGNEWLNKSILFNDFAELKFNPDRLYILTEQYADSISEASFKINEAISAQSFKVKDQFTGFTGAVKLNACLSRALECGGSVIKDGRNYYVDTIDNFISQKRKNILRYYNHSIKELCARNYYANRNMTNNRLDHNFTSISKVLLKEIKDANELVEIDLRNSQFAFLAHWVKGKAEYQDSSDFKMFLEQAGNGTLYEFIERELQLPNREAAKEIMMEIAFSSYKNGTENKRRFKELFPSVSKFIKEFKRDARAEDAPNGEGSFAVTLQRMESDVFIDNLYYQLKKMGYWVITRHDSLLVKKADEGFIAGYIRDSFRILNFRCTLK